MGRWLPAILLFGLTTLCSCAEEPDNAYPGNTQNKALKAWMTQNRPDLLENYQEEGEYYVDVVSLGDLADSAILETESWVWYDITGRDLQGNISVARDSVYALQQGTFTPYTHYVPYYQFYGELASGTFKEWTYLAMRNPLKLGETYAAQKGFPREVELRVGAEVVLYMPATIISTEANGDGGYEGQYALSANHPMIARIKLVGRSSQPIETESVAVDDFAAANGGLDPTVPPQDDDSETASVKAGEPAPSYRWKIATSEAPQIYVNESFNPADDATGLFTYSNVYVGSQQKADEIDRKINKALVERFGTDEPGELIDPEKNVRVWYIARFLDGFVQSTNIDEVKRIVYGEVESTGTYMSYTPSLNKDKQILAWYYALPHFRYGSWGALLTVSSNAYGVVGITGTTQTSSSTNYAATYAMMNYYGMMNNYYGNNYMGNYYDDYYGSYMNGLYGGSVYNPYYVDNSTSTSTTITEVLPYTPLLIEFYIEPAQ